MAGQEVGVIEVVLQAEPRKFRRLPDDERSDAVPVVAQEVGLSAAVLARSTAGRVLVPHTRRPAVTEAPEQLRVEAPVVQVLAGDVAAEIVAVDLRPVDEMVGRVVAPHDLGLPGEERPAAKMIRRLPLPDHVGAVEIGPAVGAGAVRPEEARCADLRRQAVVPVERVVPAREIEQVFEAADVLLHDRPAPDAFLADEARRGLALVGVLHAELQLGVPGQRAQPGESRARGAQTVAAEHAGVDDRLIDPIPRVRMGRVDAAELGEEVAALQLQIRGQRRGREVRLLELDVVRRIDDVSFGGEVRIDGARERELRLLEREAAPLRIVSAPLQALDLAVARGRAADGEERVERHVDELDLGVPDFTGEEARRRRAGVGRGRGGRRGEGADRAIERAGGRCGWRRWFARVLHGPRRRGSTGALRRALRIVQLLHLILQRVDLALLFGVATPQLLNLASHRFEIGALVGKAAAERQERRA